MSDTTRTPARVQLPPQIMAAIKAITADPTMSEPDRLTAAIITAIGACWYMSQDDIDARDFVIPGDQWIAIGDAIKHISDNLDGVNYALTWMNIGPSSDEKWEVGA